MTGLREVLARHTGGGSAPGAVALVARGDRVLVEAVGSVDVAGSAPMARDSIVRIASITKPVTAAAAMMLVEEGRLALDDPVRRWLPELAAPMVVRTPGSPLDDVVPAARPITVFDLLTFRAGYGFPSDFSLPAVGPLFSVLLQGPPQPQLVMAPDAWMAALSRIPLLHQPGEAWLYNTCSDILGVLIARVSGRSLPEFLAERLFRPLGMVDTGFAVPAADLDRFTSYYRRDPAGVPALVDAPDGQWSSLPAFPSAAGGLVSTVDDWYAFGRMLLAEGVVDGTAAGASRGPGATRGRRLLSAASVRQMTSDHLTGPQRRAAGMFLDRQGWGFGGSVDIEPVNSWNVPGRYGWVGGTGTAAYITPSTGAVAVLYTQLEVGGPATGEMLQDFWRCAAEAGGA